MGGSLTYTWDNPCVTAPCPTKASNHAQRIAACWYSSSETITVNATQAAGTTHQVALYLLDYDRTDRAEAITVTDAGTGAILDTRTVFASLHNGQYWVWAIAGNVKFTITAIGGGGGSGAVVSAIFFDPSTVIADTIFTYEGMVPTKTLRLPDDYAFDGWGRRIMYAVSTAMTQQNAFITIPASDGTTRMTVNDASAHAITTMAAYVLASLGTYGHGAYPRGGGSTPINYGTTNTDHRNNCDCDINAVWTGFDGVFVQKTPTQDPTTPNYTNDFDDIVVYGTRNSLRSPTE